MCRKRPGPRCSNQATHRYQRAVHNLNIIKMAVGDVDINDLPLRQKIKYLNAIRREEAAKRVYHTTPAGHEELRRIIDEQTAIFNDDGATEEAKIFARNLAQASEVALQQGIERRANSYADLRMVGEDERKKLRQQSLARGGNIGANAHPLVNSEAINRRLEEVSADAIELREWTQDDVERANSWVETRTSITDNPNAPRHPRGARNKDGRRVMLGDAVDNVAVKSTRLRVNSPDGSVSEGRHDWHVTKNEAGKFIVTLRSTVATSWEDASPVDVTRQSLGHMMDDSSSSRADVVTVMGEYDSLRGAQIARGKRMNSHDYAKSTALMGRDALVARATGDAPTQVRGLPVWHRYNEDESGSGEAI